jgi:hypothetical protein
MNYTGMWLLLNKGTQATPQRPAIVSLPVAITQFRRYRGCTDVETKPWDLVELTMTMMACQIVSYGVKSRSIECKTVSFTDWSLLGLLRRCDLMRTAKINTALIPST